MSENVQVALIRAIPNILTAIAAVGAVVLQVVGQIRHRNHERTSDANHKQGIANGEGIAEIKLSLNGALREQIEEAVERHVGERLK